LWGSNLIIVPIPSAGQTIRILYSPKPNQLLNDTDTVDAISGWEEYIVVDACIKALVKEESDPSAFMMQKQGLLKRIEEAAENRNVGEPQTVSDSKLRNFAWSDDTWGGGNGY
jgi:FKBP-type peptidyl-prolyl cis-trans isomerase 2